MGWYWGQYINCLDPVSLLTARELPPFTPDLGLNAPGVVGNNGRHEEGEEQNADDAEERTHCEWRRVGREESVPVHLLYLSVTPGGRDQPFVVAQRT